MATIDEMYAHATFHDVYRRWQDVARRAFILSADERDFSDEEFETAVWDTHAMLRKLAAHVITTAKVRDDLTQPKEILIGMDQREFIDSKKIGLRFEICADGHMTFLESPITRPQHLRRMDDDFFGVMLKLTEYGRWMFEPLDGADRHIKSNVYRLVADAQAEDLSDFGALVVRWPHYVTPEDLLSLVPQAFAVMHQLQYRLYRAEYQLRAGRKPKSRSAEVF